MEEGLKFKIWALNPDYAPFGGYFVTDEMGFAKIYPYTKFEASSFTLFKFRLGVLKFKNSTLDLTTPLFKVLCHQ